jgi:hypothetical protein
MALGRRALLVIAVAATVAARADASLPPLRVHVSPPARVLVEAAVRGGARRLARPECAGILSEFQDAAGRTLAANASRLGRSASEYVELVYFLDPPTRRGACRRPNVLAFTSPGSRVVFVCPQLAQAYRMARVDAEIAVIHEVLHTLGLGENPPSSREITASVYFRCGDH